MPSDTELDFELESQPATELKTESEASRGNDTRQGGGGFGDVEDDAIIDEAASTTPPVGSRAPKSPRRHSRGIYSLNTVGTEDS